MLLSSPVMLQLPKVLRLGVVAATLLTCTACLEHFEALWTRVVYDPFDQSFQVERRLIGVEPRFLGCSDLDECVEAIGRSVTVAPDPGYSMALSDRLLQRLVESGATEVEVALERDGDRLDVVLDYRARVGSAAADDTFVRAEWNGKGTRGAYSLVVSAQDSMDPPEHYRTRKVARTGNGEVDWIEEWVLPQNQREVRTEIAVGEAKEMFAEIPGLAEALEARGWLREATPLPPEDKGSMLARLSDKFVHPTPSVREFLPDRRAETDEAEEDRDAPPPAVVLTRGSSADGSAIVGAPDPTSPAKTWVYEARVSGGAVTPAAAAVSLEPLVPAISRCYQQRQREVPDLAGNVFLSALVRADGNVLATSVNGTLGDAVLLRCIDRALASWKFAPWGTGSEVSDVAVPVVFRVERGAPGK